MADVQMLLIDEALTEVTVANGGEMVVVNASVRNIGPIRIGMPLIEARKLLNVLMVGISQAHAQQSAKMGGAQNLAAMQGPAAFRPTDFDLGHATSPGGPMVLLRLNQQRTPLVEVMLDFPSAERLASDLLEHARKGPPEPSPRQ